MVELYKKEKKKLVKIAVAPLTGAWIEIVLLVPWMNLVWVAPLTGAWIEIRYWKRLETFLIVAPLTGAWIEKYISQQ